MQPNAQRTPRREGGFTLAEMLVSVAVLAVVSLYLTDMLVRQNRAYVVVEQTTEAQQNLRAIADLLEREVRVTGFMVPEGGAFCGYDNLGGADVVFVSDADALNPATQTQLNLVADIQNAMPAANLQVSVPGTGQGTVLDGAAFYDNDNNGVAESDFLANPFLGQFGGVIVFDRSNPAAGTMCAVITNVPNANNVSVDWNITVGAAVPTQLAPAPNFIPGGPGTDLVAVPAHWYAIVPPNATGTQAPQLWRDGMLLADDVEDLQFAAFYDLDDDGLTDPGEYSGAAGAEPVFQSNAFDNSLLRELRLNFVVRTRAQDADVVNNPGSAQGVFQTTENRVAPAGGPDGFRRRVHTLAVRPRNIGLRPTGGV